MNLRAPQGSDLKAASNLTMPAAFPLARAWAYRFLATVFSFTEPTNTIPFTFLPQKGVRTSARALPGQQNSAHMVKLVMKACLGICTLKPML